MTDEHAPAPFTHAEWVAYNTSAVNALVFGFLGALVFALGTMVGADGILVQEANGWFTVDMTPAAIVGPMVGAGGIVLVTFAFQFRSRAKQIRNSAERRSLAHNAVAISVVGMAASTVLDRLDSQDSDGETA